MLRQFPILMIFLIKLIGISKIKKFFFIFFFIISILINFFILSTEFSLIRNSYNFLMFFLNIFLYNKIGIYTQMAYYI